MSETHIRPIDETDVGPATELLVVREADLERAARSLHADMVESVRPAPEGTPMDGGTRW